jgi:hypothetical protein
MRHPFYALRARYSLMLWLAVFVVFVAIGLIWWWTR